MERWFDELGNVKLMVMHKERGGEFESCSIAYIVIFIFYICFMLCYNFSRNYYISLNLSMRTDYNFTSKSYKNNPL